MMRTIQIIQILLISMLFHGSLAGSSLPKGGKVLHLDAGEIEGVNDGARLEEGWAGSAGRLAVPGDAPRYISDGGGGYPAVRFDGVGEHLRLDLATGGNMTAIVVFANRRSERRTQYRETLLSAVGATNTLRLNSSRYAEVAPDYPSFSTHEKISGQSTTWVNGHDTAASGRDVLPGRYYVGCAEFRGLSPGETLIIGAADENGNAPGKNDIREIIVYDRILSASERRGIFRTLGFKYDLPVVWKPLDHPLEKYRYILGSQQFGKQYSFGEAGIRVLDYARASLRQGNRVAKFRLSNKSERVDGFRRITGIDTLVELARDHPEVKEVLDLPIQDYLFWASSLQVSRWQNRIGSQGLESSAQEAIYDEIYDFVVYLLEEYNGSGKSFYLGNWEGDWMLSGSNTYTPEEIPENRIQAMIDWANTRQRAIDDAKANTPHENVNVWFYVEMNKLDWAREGRPCVANSVIPAMPKLDFISISAYSVHKYNGRPAPTVRVHADLDLVQSLIDDKPDASIPGSRMMIGEYGWIYRPDKYESLKDFARDHIATVRDFLSWPGGTLRFILQWQFYNNATRGDGGSKEMYQVSEDNELSPLYYMHENFYREMRRWVEYYDAMHGEVPSHEAFEAQADHVLANLELSQYSPQVEFTDYEDWKAYNFPGLDDRSNTALSGPKADPLDSGVPNLRRYASDLKLLGTRQPLNPEVFLSGDELVLSFPYDGDKTDLVWTGEGSDDLSTWPHEIFSSSDLDPNYSNDHVEFTLGQDGSGDFQPRFFRLSLELKP